MAKKADAKSKESFMSKYGVFIIIIALLAIFLIIALVGGTGKDKNSSKSGEVTSTNVSKWIDQSKKDDVMVTVFAQTTCSWCEKFKPVVKQVIGETGAKIYWIDVDLLSEDDMADLEEAYEELQDFGTPYTLITKSGKKIDEIDGYVEKSELVNTLKDNGVIK